MPPVPHPVTAIREAPDISDRATPNQFGQLEDLCHGQDGALRCSLGSGSADAARVASEDLVLVDSCASWTR